MTGFNKVLDIPAGITVGDKFYFKTYRATLGLYCYNMSQKKLQIIEEPKELNAAWERYSYCGAIKADRYIVFIPYFGKHFVFLNTENDQVLYFKKCKNSVYYTAVEYEKKVFVFSEKIEDTVVFELNDFSYSYPFEGQSSETKLLGGINVGIKNSKVILTTDKPDCVAQVDLELCSVEYKMLENRGMFYNLVVPYKEGYILTGDQPVILLWDGMKKYRYVSLEKWVRQEKIPWKHFFTNALTHNNKVYFGPLNYKKFISLDLDNMQVEYLYEMQYKEISYLSEMCDGILLSIVEDDEPKRNCIYTDNGSVFDCNAFELNDSFKFSGSQKEYSRVALRFFLEDVKNS